MKFAIIIPTYQEKENLIILLPQLVKLYPQTPIFVVDDNSQDGTDIYILNLSQKHPQLHFVARSKKMGRGGAVLTGLKKAYQDKNLDYFLEMDADFSHQPKEIKRLLKKAESKTIVIGSRYVLGSRIINWPILRQVLSKLANLYARVILQILINDYTNGFRLYPRLAVEKILQSKLTESGYALLSEVAYILYQDGFTFVEVPTTFVNRKKGETKTNFAEYLKSLFSIIRIRLNY